MKAHLTLLAFVLAGGALGAVYFATLYRNVRLYVEDRRRSTAILLEVARLAFTAATFVFIAKIGGAPGLLSAALGFLFARRFVMARVERLA
jgi:F1F0 ATPase subunit 2